MALSRTIRFILTRFLTSSSSITKPSTLPSFILRRPLAILSHPLPLTTPSFTRFTTVRYCVHQPGDSAYSPPDSDSNISHPPPTETNSTVAGSDFEHLSVDSACPSLNSDSSSCDLPPNDKTSVSAASVGEQRSGDSPLIPDSNFKPPLIPGCDYKHWLIVMDNPGGSGAAKQEMIDSYIQMLAKVVGSEEEAKRKIYNISCERFYGFGCEIDVETSKKLEDLPGVLFVVPDSYVDAEFKDYGGELLVNGVIVQRSPERQRRVNPVPVRAQDKPRDNGRTGNVRRREEQLPNP